MLIFDAALAMDCEGLPRVISSVSRFAVLGTSSVPANFPSSINIDLCQRVYGTEKMARCFIVETEFVASSHVQHPHHRPRRLHNCVKTSADGRTIPNGGYLVTATGEPTPTASHQSGPGRMI